MPSFKMFFDKKLIGELGHQLVGVHYIKRNYRILDKNLYLLKNDDVIDFLFSYKNKLLFMRVLTFCNNKRWNF